MADLTGLFTRGSSYYLRVVLPDSHPATSQYRSGKVVLSLGACSRREAISKGTILRAEILRGGSSQSPQPIPAVGWTVAQPAADPRPEPPTYLRDVYDKWVEAKPRS